MRRGWLRKPLRSGHPSSGRGVEALTWHAQLLCQPLAKGLGTEHTLIHANAPHRDEGAHVQGSHPRVLPCREMGDEDQEAQLWARTRAR